MRNPVGCWMVVTGAAGGCPGSPVSLLVKNNIYIDRLVASALGEAAQSCALRVADVVESD